MVYVFGILFTIDINDSQCTSPSLEHILNCSVEIKVCIRAEDRVAILSYVHIVASSKHIK